MQKLPHYTQRDAGSPSALRAWLPRAEPLWQQPVHMPISVEVRQDMLVDIPTWQCNDEKMRCSLKTTSHRGTSAAAMQQK